METHPRELLEDLDRIREREQLVARERELLERVLELLLESGGPSADWLTDPARGVLTIGSLRSQILRVLAFGSPGELWIPRDVHEQLVAHGNNKASLDNVRTTMSRMAGAEELIQPDPTKLFFGLP
jgi:hypothetical protein